MTRPAASRSRASSRSPAVTASTRAFCTAATESSLQVMADQERVDTGGERQHGAPLDTDGVADRLHLERIRDHEPVEAELAAQQALHDRPTQRRGRVVERGDPHVSGHDRLHAGIDRRAERQQPVADVAGHDRQLEVRVLLRRAVAGEVLRAGRDPRDCSPVTKAATWRATSSGSEPNERTPITGLSGLMLTSATGAKFRFTPTAARSAADRGRDLLGQRDVVDGAERPVAGIRAAADRSRAA